MSQRQELIQGCTPFGALPKCSQDYTPEENELASTAEGRTELLKRYGFNDFLDAVFRGVVIEGPESVDDIKNQIVQSIINADSEEIKLHQKFVDTMSYVCAMCTQ